MEDSSPDYSNALPLSLRIEQFWAWLTPGFVSLTVSFDSRVVMTGDNLVVDSPATAMGKYSTGTGAAFESVWLTVIQAGIADLSAKMEEKISPPTMPAVMENPSSVRDADIGS